MKYDPINRTLQLERKDCRNCYGTGTQAAKVKCERCKGTGNGPRGGKGGCKICLGHGTNYDHYQQVPCGRCKGSPKDHDMETFCDHVPEQTLKEMPLRVVRQNRDTSWNESFLGLGCLYSVTDYGTSANLSDEEFVAKVREEMNDTQGVKIVRDHKAPPVMVKVNEGTKWEREIEHQYDRTDPVPVCDEVLIVVSRSGYSLRAGWRDDQSALSRAAAEPGRDLAMLIGGAVHAAGGNGTLAAALPYTV